jgi:catechol 2,3-dioxygenase-like lactoylglutathione lyase family enzyme
MLRISRVVSDLVRAEAFYARMGFRRVEAAAVSKAAELLGLLDVTEVVLRLGAQEIALVQCNPPGPAYPSTSHSNDLWFQHLAIVVSDIERAVRALGPVEAISIDGLQVLPPSSGGVAAFKFRDPDGHPLELIHFPPGQGRAVWQVGGEGLFLGIDHSALAIGSGRRSLGFYRRLGFRVVARSFNHGAAQSRLDGLPGAAVHVSGLRIPGADGPGLELLRYMPPGRPRPHTAANAMLTDWVTLSVPGEQSRVVADPDGHLLVLERQSLPADDVVGGVHSTLPYEVTV